MAISEAQLDTWSKQGSITQSKATYDSIKAVLNDPKSPYYQHTFDIFLQGSYGNDTNVYADSDVDIIIRLTSIYYYDDSDLSDQEKTHFQSGFTPGPGYSFQKFKSEVLAWLRAHYGGSVVEGKKAITIPGNNYRRDADVLVCVNHRHYWSYQTPTTPHYSEGICFWTRDGGKIVNYPKQHMENCTAKHQNTSNRFKANVRVLKNMRNTMIEKNYLADGVAPSYFLEDLLSNVPNNLFTYRYSDTFANYMNWLDTCDRTKLTCANDIHWLLRDGYPTSWTEAKLKEFKSAAVTYWNSQ